MELNDTHIPSSIMWIVVIRCLCNAVTKSCSGIIVSLQCSTIKLQSKLHTRHLLDVRLG